LESVARSPLDHPGRMLDAQVGRSPADLRELRVCVTCRAFRIRVAAAMIGLDTRSHSGVRIDDWIRGPS